MSELLNKYIKDCIRTESKLETLKLNPEVVSQLFEIYENLGEILDGLKKHTFYNKGDKLSAQFAPRLEKISSIANSLSKRPISFILSKEDTDLNSRMFHGILGIMTESSELSQIWSKHMCGEGFDAVNVQEEMGDQNWYHSIINDELKLDPEETLHKNIRKLRKRFPEKYTDEAAEHRDLNAERAELER